MQLSPQSSSIPLVFAV